MFKRILEMDNSDKLMQGRLLNYALNGLKITYVGEVDDIEDLNDIVINVSLERQKTHMIMQSCTLSSLLKFSDFRGGYQFDSDNDRHPAYISLGKIYVKEGQSLHVSITNMMPDTNIFDLEVDAVKLISIPESVVGYQCINASGDTQQLSSVKQIFATSPYLGEASITDQNGSSGLVSYQQGKDFIRAVGINDTRNDEFAMVWKDDTDSGQNISATLPLGTYLIVKKYIRRLKMGLLESIISWGTGILGLYDKYTQIEQRNETQPIIQPVPYIPEKKDDNMQMMIMVGLGVIALILLLKK